MRNGIVNKKIKIKTVALAVMLIIAVFVLATTSLPKVRETRVKNAIRRANYCREDADCVDVGSKCPFGCYAYVHKNEVRKVSDIIAAYDSNCVYRCLRCPTAICQDGACKPVCER
jgi:hypothetical protein